MKVAGVVEAENMSGVAVMRAMKGMENIIKE
jgi:hypothetical protein